MKKTDFVDREKLIDAMCNDCYANKYFGCGHDYLPCHDIIRIKEFPAAEVRPVMHFDEENKTYTITKECQLFSEKIRAKTNGDNFRAMTDEELAETFALMSCCEKNYPNCYKYNISGGGRDCVKCWTDFLKAEAKE